MDILGKSMGYIREKLWDIMGKNYRIYWTKLWDNLGKTYAIYWVKPVGNNMQKLCMWNMSATF